MLDYELPINFDRIRRKEKSIAHSVFKPLSTRFAPFVNYDDILSSARFRDTAEVYYSTIMFEATVTVFVVWFLANTYGILASILSFIIQLLVDVFNLAAILGIDQRFIVSLIELLQQPGRIVREATQAPDIPITLLGIFFGGLVLVVRFYYPIYVANERTREIDQALPKIISHMYALAEGGLTAAEIFDQIASEEQMYGEGSGEIQRIDRIAKQTGENIVSAMEKVSQTTGSERLSEFIDDYVRVLRTGTSEKIFLDNASDKAVELRQERQERVLSIIEYFSFAYVLIFVISPVIMSLVLVAIGVQGSVNRGLLQAVTYFIIPAGGIGFVLIVFIVSSTSDIDWSPLTPKRDPQDYAVGKKAKSEDKTEARLSTRSYEELLRYITNNPSFGFIMTIPITAVFIFLVFRLELIDPEFSPEDFYNPTLYLFIIPLNILISVPGILYEIRAYRERKVNRRLPALFDSIAEASEQGLTVTDSIKVAVDTGDGILRNQLERSLRRARVTNNISSALIEYANRLRSQRLSYSVLILNQANEISTGIHKSVQKVADNLEEDYQLDRERAQRSFFFVGLIVAGFILSIYITDTLNRTFLNVVSDSLNNSSNSSGSTSNGPSAPSGQGAGGGFSQGAKIFIQRIFFHLILAISVTSGFFTGAIRRNDVLDGIKFVMILTGICAVYFGFFA